MTTTCYICDEALVVVVVVVVVVVSAVHRNSGSLSVRTRIARPGANLKRQLDLLTPRLLPTATHHSLT
jgi:hypothetical protein